MEESLNLIGQRGEFFAKRKSLINKFRLGAVVAILILIGLSAGAYWRVRVIKQRLELADEGIAREEAKLNELALTKQKLMLVREGYTRAQKTVVANESFLNQLDYLEILILIEGINLESQLLEGSNVWELALAMQEKAVFDRLDQQLAKDLEAGKMKSYKITQIGVDQDGYHYSVVINFSKKEVANEN